MHNTLKVGSYQGSLISPILCNIYLHALDVYVEECILQFNKGLRRAANPEYTKLHRGPQTFIERKKTRNLIHKKGIRAKKPNDEKFKRLRYIRYADDFILGVIGSKQDAKDILDKIKIFLKENLRLTLSIEKTKITHATTDNARFLGIDIHITPYEKNPLRTVKYKGGEPITVKGTTRPQLLAPIKDIVRKLKLKGYISKKGKPCRVGRLMHYTREMIVDHYLRIAHGLINYYSFVNNYARTRARLLYILKYSCALTLCSKLRLRTIHKTFTKFGYNLEIKNDKGKIIKSFDESKFPKSSFGFKNVTYDPISIIELAAKIVPRTRMLFESTKCTICDSISNIEMHHLKHLKNMKQRTSKNLDYLTRIMISMNRKQIPLCTVCHREIHAGKYNQTKLSKLSVNK